MKNLLCLIISLVIHQIAIGCSCFSMVDVDPKYLKPTDAIFVGTVIKSEVVNVSDTLYNVISDNDTVYVKGTIVRYTLQADSVIKGNVTSDTIIVYTGEGGGDCGIELRLLRKYKVYSYNDSYLGDIYRKFTGQNIFWTNECDETRLIN